MKTAQEFLTEFVKDIVKHPMERQQLIAGWAKHLEAREFSRMKEARTNPLVASALDSAISFDNLAAAIREAEEKEGADATVLQS